MTVSVRMAVATQPLRHRAGHALVAAMTGVLALSAGPVLAQAPLPPGEGGFGAPIGAPVGGAIGGPIAAPAEATPAGGVVPPPVAAPPAAYSTPRAAFQAGTLGLPFTPEPAAEPSRRLTLLPSLGAEVLATDNLNQAATNPRREVVTTLRPGLIVNLDALRLQGRLSYQPSIELYASDASRPRVLQRFNGQALGTIVPNLLFLDLRGSGAVQAARGGFAPETLETTGRNGVVQTTSFQVSPYLLHRFGELGTLQAGYAFQSVTQDSQGSSEGLFTPGGQRFFADQDFTAHALYAVARSGPAFGRFALEARLSSTDYDGTGVLDGAHRRSGTLEVRYAITRSIAVLAEGGYESLRYGGTPGFRLDEPVWGVGVRLAPSPESAITLRYNRRSGFESPSVEAVVALGGRTRLFASYAETLTTGAQRAADLLSTTTLDALGNPVDALTGAPVFQPFGDSFLGAQNSLQRIRRATVTLTQTWLRDNFALTFTSEQQRPVSFAPGSTGFAQRGHTINFSWARALSPETTGLVGLQYGRREREGQGDTDVYGLNLGLSTQLRPRLNGYVRYALTSRTADLAEGRSVQNIVVVGLRQSF